MYVVHVLCAYMYVNNCAFDVCAYVRDLIMVSHRLDVTSCGHVTSNKNVHVFRVLQVLRVDEWVGEGIRRGQSESAATDRS